MAKRTRNTLWRRLWFESHLLFVCAIVSASLSGCARTADPEQTIRNLYGWYMRELKNNVNPLTERRIELKQFLSERMFTSIDNLRVNSNRFDGSALLDPQQFDQNWHSQIAIEQIKTRGGTATGRVTIAGRLIGKQTFNVALIKEDGLWKVDDVKIVDDSG
jgi:Protein of unknown function (DUF3828)